MPNPSWACALCHLAPPDVARSKRKRDLCDLCEPGLAARGLAWCTGRKLRDPHRVAIGNMVPGRAWCRECDRAYALALGKHADRARAWRERNTERSRAYFRQPDVRARRLARSAAWRAANPTRAKELRHARYLRHREAEKARAVAWRAANPDRVRATTKVCRLRRKLAILRGWRRAA